MTKLRFVGLDGEMTGAHDEFAAKKFQLIQIGLATADMKEGIIDPKSLAIFTSDIGYDEYNFEDEAMGVNKFTPERIKAGPIPSAVDKEASAWLDAHMGNGKRDLHAVGWNVGSFDMPFVRRYLPVIAKRFSYRAVDLNSIVFGMTDNDGDYKYLKGRAKDAAAKSLAIRFPEPKWHDAGYDSAAALMAFKALREEIAFEAFA